MKFTLDYMLKKCLKEFQIVLFLSIGGFILDQFSEIFFSQLNYLPKLQI